MPVPGRIASSPECGLSDLACGVFVRRANYDRCAMELASQLGSERSIGQRRQIAMRWSPFANRMLYVPHCQRPAEESGNGWPLGIDSHQFRCTK